MDLEKIIDKAYSDYSSTSLEEDKSIIYGIFTSICLSTELFKRNIDLKPFVERLFKEYSEYDFDKDYLYKSRSNILAKSLREIQKFKKYECESFFKSIQYLTKDYLIINEKNKEENFIDYWSKGIDNLNKGNDNNG